MAQQHTIGKSNTTVHAVDGVTTITLHKTAVVRFTDKTVKLNTGGWKTVTTKTRMNQTSAQFGIGYSVYAKRGKWFVDFKGTTFPFDDKTLELTR